MLHKSDIEADLARGTLSGIEDGFRALVGWPKHDTVGGLDSADDAMILLRDTAYALGLLHDTRIMPSDTMGVLEGIAEDRGEKLVGGWYATGAAFVLDRIEVWWPVFERSFGEAS